MRNPVSSSAVVTNNHVQQDRHSANKLKHIPKGIHTLSLFSGAGGLDLGFAAAGFNICCAMDIDPYSCRTLRLNSVKRSFMNSHAVLEKNIYDFSADDAYREAKLRKGEFEFIIGGPPCQAFSVFGRRGGLADPRGSLVWEYLRIVKELRPFGFVFENVGGLKSIHNGELYSELLEALSCDGLYAVSSHGYEVANYGIPQFRYRLFFIGLRNGQLIREMPETHGESSQSELKPWVTVSKVLSDMPSPGPGKIPNHFGRHHSQRIIERYRDLHFGERDSRTRINRLDPNRPSFTIIVGSDAGGGKGHVHPYSPREVTPRESARLQTFPDWWEFAGTGRHVIRQVGNAVPPLFAALLANYILKETYGAPNQSYNALVRKIGLDYLL